MTKFSNVTFFQPVNEWMGHALFDLVHPDDKDKIREQLSLHDNQSPGDIEYKK